MNLVDSHCHIDGEQFDDDRDEVVARAHDAGVTVMLVVGTGDPHSGDIRRAVDTAERYQNVFASVGVHPHDSNLYDDKAEQHLLDLVRSSSKVIAWGEIGLDYYYDHSPRDVQRKVFRRQIAKARELGLPIIVHSRDADADTTRILIEECSGEGFAGGIMHCFGGSARMAEDLTGLGFLISFAGNVTFKKAEELRDAAKRVPIEKLLVETDCPFLAPVPFRGRRNEPAFVVDTARFLSELRGTDLEVLAQTTTQNFLRLFPMVHGSAVEKDKDDKSEAANRGEGSQQQ
jgi:TatD DNase family protein